MQHGDFLPYKADIANRVSKLRSMSVQFLFAAIDQFCGVYNEGHFTVTENS